LPRGNFAADRELLGMTLESTRSDGRDQLRERSRARQPMGTLHGGVLCDIADAAMGIAYAMVWRDETSPRWN